MSILKREELYQDIWSRPATKIAGELSISSSALKRTCKAMKIPTPAVGHWTKVVFIEWEFMSKISLGMLMNIRNTRAGTYRPICKATKRT